MNRVDSPAGLPRMAAAAPSLYQARRQLMAAMIGNVLEYYDFIVYAFLAATLARKFFHTGEFAGLLASFAAFGVGFLARPVGGAIIGRIADKHGRRIALLITIFGMALGTVGIGLLPTYQAIGVLAPVLLVALRLIQGLSAGGEWGSATSFIIESAPHAKRGLYGSIGQASIASSTLVSSVLVAIVSAVFTPAQMDDWAWRVPFLLGAILIPIGFYMRRNMAETAAFAEVRAHPASTAALPRGAALGMMSKAFGFTIIWTVSYYVMLSYMPTFLVKYAGLTQTQALTSNSIALVVLVATMPFFGWLSDRVGRKPLLIGCCVGFALISYALFRVILGGASFSTILAVQIVFNLFIAAFSGAAPAALCELFPTHSRTTLLSIGYSLSTAIFGGFAPFISTWLIGETGSPIGEIDGTTTPRVRELHAAMQSFEPAALLSEDIWSYLWGKLGYGSLLFAQAVGQLGIADCLARGELLPLWRSLAGEAMRVAHAEGITPRGFNGFEPASFQGRATEAQARNSVAAMVAFNRPNAKTHSGVWRDLAVRKRRTEVDLQLAPIVLIGRSHGIDCVKLHALVGMIHEIEDGKRPLSDNNLNELLSV